METRLSGSAFQIMAAATAKARLPTVRSLNGRAVSGGFNGRPLVQWPTGPQASDVMGPLE